MKCKECDHDPCVCMDAETYNYMYGSGTDADGMRNPNPSIPPHLYESERRPRYSNYCYDGRCSSCTGKLPDGTKCDCACHEECE